MISQVSEIHCQVVTPGPMALFSLPLHFAIVIWRRIGEHFDRILSRSWCPRHRRFSSGYHQRSSWRVEKYGDINKSDVLMRFLPEVGERGPPTGWWAGGCGGSSQGSGCIISSKMRTN